MQIVKNYLLLLPLLTAFFSVGQDSLDTALQKRIYTIYQLDQQCRDQMKRYYNTNWILNRAQNRIYPNIVAGLKIGYRFK